MQNLSMYASDFDELIFAVFQVSISKMQTV